MGWRGVWNSCGRSGKLAAVGKERTMKIFVVAVIVAVVVAAVAPVSAAHTVAEACGECVMPEGMENLSANEVLVEAYFALEFDSVQKVSAVIRRIVSRELSGSATIILVDQIVTETSPLFGHIGPGPIVRITIVAEGGLVEKPYEWKLQEIVEFSYLLKYGGRGYQW